MADKDHYNRSIKVPQSVIDDIKKMGMAAAIKKANESGADSAFREGVRRFYPAAIKDMDKNIQKQGREAQIKSKSNTRSSGTVAKPSANTAARRLNNTKNNRSSSSNSDEWRAARDRVASNSSSPRTTPARVSTPRSGGLYGGQSQVQNLLRARQENANTQAKAKRTERLESIKNWEKKRDTRRASRTPFSQTAIARRLKGFGKEISDAIKYN